MTLEARVYPVVQIYLELAGRGNGLTDVSRDVRTAVPVGMQSGIHSSKPQACTADTGTLRFALDNSEANSVGVVGFYSPSNPACCTGFARGIRAFYVVNGYWKFVGTIDDIGVIPGVNGERLTLVTAVDFMDDLARFPLVGLPILTSTNAKAVLEQILAAMPQQPNATDLDTGTDTYDFAPANPRETTGLAEAQLVASSELGKLVLRGGRSQAQAGTLTLFSRGAFVQPPLNQSQFTLTKIAPGMLPQHSRSQALNVFRMSVHPRTVDSSFGFPAVLFTLQHQPSIDPGKTYTFVGQYSDPTQRAARVAGYSMIQPVNLTDIMLNENAAGTGADLYANFTVTADYGPQGVRYSLTNNGAVTAVLAFLQARGYGLYDWEPITVEVRDAASVAANGESPVPLDFFYHKDPSFAKNAGEYLLTYWKDPDTLVERVSFYANIDQEHMDAATEIEPGDRIKLQEVVSGIDQFFHINAVDHALVDGVLLLCTWTLSPLADETQYGIIDDPVYGLIDSTMVMSL